MKILIKRRFFGDTYTIGTMYIDGVRFCDTLEDKNRDINHNGVFDGEEKKVMTEQAIPFGPYEVVCSMSHRFYREPPRMLAVPESGVRPTP